MAGVGNGDLGLFEQRAINIVDCHTRQQRDAGTVFGVAVAHTRRLNHRGIINSLDRELEGAGLAIERGVFGVHHRISNPNKVNAIKFRNQL